MFLWDDVGGSLENCRVIDGLEGDLYISSETVEIVSAYSVQHAAAAVRAAAARFFHLRILILPAGVFRNVWKTFLLPFVFLRSEILSLVLSTMLT